MHLLAAMDHATRAVLAQRQVDGAPGEVPAFQPLLDGLDSDGVVVTADALHTHVDAAEFLVTQKQAHYLLVVKANQCAARRLAVSPNGVGRDSKRYLWVRWLTWIRKEKGTRACHGRPWRGGSTQTHAYQAWLRSQRFDQPAMTQTFGHYLAVVEVRNAQLDAVEADLADWCDQAPFDWQVARLAAYRGITRPGALTLAAEVADWRRFATANAFMGFAGWSQANTPTAHPPG